MSTFFNVLSLDPKTTLSFVVVEAWLLVFFSFSKKCNFFNKKAANDCKSLQEKCTSTVKEGGLLHGRLRFQRMFFAQGNAPVHGEKERIKNYG